MLLLLWYPAPDKNLQWGIWRVLFGRYLGGHEGGVPEVWFGGLRAHPQGEPGKRTGSSIFQTTLDRKPPSLPVVHHCSLLVSLSRQVFVEYTNSTESKEAQRMLTGRTFDCKFVVATFYPRSSYKRGYLYQCSHWRPARPKVTPSWLCGGKKCTVHHTAYLRTITVRIQRCLHVKWAVFCLILFCIRS